MATVSTEYKRLFIRDLSWVAEESSISLYEAIKAAARGRLSETKTGKAIIGVAGNGKSVTFNTPNLGSFTPQVAAELCSEMLDRYEDATAALAQEDVDSPTDAQILDEMLAMLQIVDEAQSDFSEIRRYI